MLKALQTELTSRLSPRSTANRRIFFATAGVAAASGVVLVVSTAKELAVAQWFGRADAFDAFLIAYVLPAFVVSIAGGSFSSAVVPTFVEVRDHKGHDAAQRLFSGVLVWSLLLLVALSLALGVFAPYYVPLLGSGFSAAKLALTRRLLYVLLPFVVLSGLSATCTAILNAGERFALPALAPGLVPLGAVVFLWTLGHRWGILALAVGTVLGAAAQTAILIAQLRSRGMRLGLGWYRLDPNLRRVAGQYVPMVAGALLMGTTDLVDQAMAAMLQPGSVAALNYARKIVSVFIVLGAVPLGTAALPYFSQMAAKRDWSACVNTLKTYSRLVALLTVPITAALVIFSTPLVRVLFERGAFTPQDTNLVSRVQALLALEIPFYVLGTLAVRVLSALKRNSVIAGVAAFNTLLNVVLNYLFMKRQGVAGIALSTSVVYLVSCALVFGAIAVVMRRLRANEAREVSMESVACNLCGSTRSTPVYTMPDRLYFPDEWFTVIECNECGLGFVNPRPTFDEMQKYYPPRYYQEEFVDRRDYHLKRYAREARYLRPIEARRAAPGPTLLDVGCANGDFPRFMQARGWHVEGVEVSATTQPIRDFKVYAQPFPEIPVDAPTYDATTAWAVLEHVHDPMAYFRQAARVTKPGGLLVFLVTNFRSLASRHLFAEDVPRHLYFFTAPTVRRYLETVGFELESARYGRDVYEMPPANWLRYFMVTRLERRPFTFQDLPPSRPEFLRGKRLTPGLCSTLQFALQHPAKVLDRALWPIIEALQIMRSTYGVCTYVARRS